MERGGFLRSSVRKRTKRVKRESKKFFKLETNRKVEANRGKR